MIDLEHIRIIPIVLIFLTIFPESALPSEYKKDDFALWIKKTKVLAQKKGISKRTLNLAFTGLKLDPKVIEIDRNQTPPADKDFKSIIDDWKTFLKRANKEKYDIFKRGSLKIKKHDLLLKKISLKYGVPPSIIVAIWGVESRYGSYTGNFSVIRSLATLAYEGRRKSFFTKQLISALRIIQNGHITPKDMLGSWAGAMGQCQFMPSNYFYSAVDFNQDGKRDIWKTYGDIFASIANHLKKARWKKDKPWGKLVLLPKDFNKKLIQKGTKRSTTEWIKMGIKAYDGTKLTKNGFKAKLIKLNIRGAPALLAYDNLKVILRWNRSLLFAAKVSYLSNHIKR